MCVCALVRLLRASALNSHQVLFDASFCSMWRVWQEYIITAKTPAWCAARLAERTFVHIRVFFYTLPCVALKLQETFLWASGRWKIKYLWARQLWHLNRSKTKGNSQWPPQAGVIISVLSLPCCCNLFHTLKRWSAGQSAGFVLHSQRVSHNPKVSTVTIRPSGVQSHQSSRASSTDIFKNNFASAHLICILVPRQMPAI